MVKVTYQTRMEVKTDLFSDMDEFLEYSLCVLGGSKIIKVKMV